MLNNITIQPWQDIARQHPTTYQVLGVYANGAAKIKGTPHWATRIAFLDCPVCHGEGEIKTVKGHYGWTGSVDYEQCQTCAVRFGLKEAIIARAKQVIALAKSEVNTAKREGEDVKSGAFIEAFNLTNPLAHEYRRLLYQLWSYQEPEYTELVKN